MVRVLMRHQYPVDIISGKSQTVCYGGKRVAVCTDLGVFNDYTVACLKGMDALLLEANHDVNMLQVGPYPYYLRLRCVFAAVFQNCPDGSFCCKDGNPVLSAEHSQSCNNCGACQWTSCADEREVVLCVCGRV